MKLKHGKNFANRQGSTWRMLFVFALMPWMRRYRIQEEKEEEKENELDRIQEGKDDELQE